MRAGDFIFVSGQVAKDEKGNMCVGNIEDETRWTLEAIKRILALEGADLSDVVKMTTYLEDAPRLRPLQRRVQGVLPGRECCRAPPSRRARSSSCKIEMDAVAYKPKA